MSPIINPNIKFSWFRMSTGPPPGANLNESDNRENFESQVQLVEEAHSAWFAPTVDDIGCIICAQCEDNFDQGCSRYVEVKFLQKYIHYSKVSDCLSSVRSHQSRFVIEYVG